MEKYFMSRPEIRLWQGMARYATSFGKYPSLDGVGMGEAVASYKMKTIEDWKIAKIPQFTLALPKAKDRMALCRLTSDISGLSHVAAIYHEMKSTKLTYYKISESLSDIACNGTPIGYLSITNTKGDFCTYEFSIEPIPFMEDPDGVIAFADGSGGGGEFKPEKDFPYMHQYGGAYMLFKPGETVSFADSENGETDPISDGLKGLAPRVGNVYGEVNAAILAIKRADSLGFKHLRLYYDCEQIGGHAPGGAYQNHNEPITVRYRNFLDTYQFTSLEIIELIHVDGHVGIAQNEAVDQAAKRSRDSVADEYISDAALKELYLAHAEDYIA
jgi:ribonuclease HI